MQSWTCGNGELATAGHRILIGDEWVPAGKIFNSAKMYDGPVYNAHIQTDEQCDLLAPNTEHSYKLANGLFAHNFLPS